MSPGPLQGSFAVRACPGPEADARAAELCATPARRSGHEVTVTWGPRSPQPTGRSTEEDRQAAAFLQRTAHVPEDLAVHERPPSPGTPQARAADERQAAVERGRPLPHLHLTHRDAGIARLLGALG